MKADETFNDLSAENKMIIWSPKVDVPNALGQVKSQMTNDEFTSVSLIKENEENLPEDFSLSNEARLVFNSYLAYWKAIFEFAMGMFQNMAQMFKNTSESFLTILDYKYSEGKEEDEEKDSGDSGEKADG